MILICVTFWLALITERHSEHLKSWFSVDAAFCFLHLPSKGRLFQVNLRLFSFYTFISIIFPPILKFWISCFPNLISYFYLGKNYYWWTSSWVTGGLNVLALCTPLDLLICLEALAMETEMTTEFSSMWLGVYNFASYWHQQMLILIMK